VLSNSVEAQQLINKQVPSRNFDLEKLKLPLPTLDHQHLHLLKREDFHLVEVTQPEMTFSNLAEVRQIPTQLANQDQRVHSLLGAHPTPSPLLGVPRNPNPLLGVPRNPNPLLVGLNRHFSVPEVGLQLVQPLKLNLLNNLSHLIQEVPVVLPI
jgi:hypothetical protein